MRSFPDRFRLCVADVQAIAASRGAELRRMAEKAARFSSERAAGLARARHTGLRP